jgi:tetratricopeptide (TPR) repeat protein
MKFHASDHLSIIANKFSMKQLFTLLAALCLLLPATAQTPAAIPALRITNDKQQQESLGIHQLDIRITVTANIATTVFDILFYNPYNRILEGEFAFPLSDGQNIVSYALDVNGKLREGVVVEKKQARIAFENTVRRNIDPGLVEKTKGNFFRTRIYPIPAKGYKRVQIGLQQTLGYQGSDLLYLLPLQYSSSIDSFSIVATVFKSRVAPQLQSNDLTNFRFNEWQENYTARFSGRKYKPNGKIAFTIPSFAPEDYAVFTETRNGTTYFYVHGHMQPQRRARTAPNRIGILWDVSASGQTRDLAKELLAIEYYLQGLKNVSVDIIPFHITPLPKTSFTIRGGDASAVIQHLKKSDYDGGTQLGAVDLNNYDYDALLLFTDGISTFGRSEIKTGSRPLTIISSAPGADYGYLKSLAAQTHGLYIDLNTTTLPAALDMLRSDNLQLIHASSSTGVQEVNLPVNATAGNDISLSGILAGDEGMVTLYFGYGSTVVGSRNFIIRKKAGELYPGTDIARLWAEMKIAQLEVRAEKNKTQITETAKQFGVVTAYTSLLVLDRVEDYVEYKIIPPPELQQEYFSLLAKEEKVEIKVETEDGLEEALAAMEKLKAWYHADYSSRNKKDKQILSGSSNQVMANSVRAFAAPSPPPPADARVEVINESGNAATTQVYSLSTSGNAYNWSMMGESYTATDDNRIQLGAWKPDAAYLKKMQQTPADNWWSSYLQLKKENGNTPAFYSDMAQLFFEKGRKEEALRILSNMAEMKLEDAELLRTLAYHLLDQQQTDYAVFSFEEVLRMREEEPQSYRDLALVYEQQGLHQRAVDALYKLVLGKWDTRFGEVKAIALNELNAILAANPGLNTDSIDARLIYAMPVDVRIVVSWSANNSDVDLWVTDPLKEKCSYQHTLTDIGGRISRDVTQGYGPEEFMLKKAAKGDYKIEVQYYGDSRQTTGGPVTLRAELYTNYGRVSQQRKTINVRLEGGKQVIRIGSLKFGKQERS